jgi:hypothetical protein
VLHVNHGLEPTRGQLQSVGLDPSTRLGHSPEALVERRDPVMGLAPRTDPRNTVYAGADGTAGGGSGMHPHLPSSGPGQLTRATRARLLSAGLRPVSAPGGGPAAEVGRTTWALDDEDPSAYGAGAMIPRSLVSGARTRPMEPAHHQNHRDQPVIPGRGMLAPGFAQPQYAGDGLRRSEFTVQFLAFGAAAVGGSYGAAPTTSAAALETTALPARVHFTFQFYHFPPLKTERLTLLREPTDAPLDPCVLVRSSHDGGRQPHQGPTRTCTSRSTSRPGS